MWCFEWKEIKVLTSRIKRFGNKIYSFESNLNWILMFMWGIYQKTYTRYRSSKDQKGLYEVKGWRRSCWCISGELVAGKFFNFSGLDFVFIFLKYFTTYFSHFNIVIKC